MSMTTKQADCTEGFLELLSIAGRALSWDNLQFNALIKSADPAQEEYDLTPGDDTEVVVSALLSNFNDGLPRIGDVLSDEDSYNYRIQKIERIPGKPVVRFHCQVTKL